MPSLTITIEQQSKLNTLMPIMQSKLTNLMVVAFQSFDHLPPGSQAP